MIDDRRIARRYAKAFLRGDVDKDSMERLASEFRTLVNIIDDDPEIHEFFRTPLAPKKRKIDAVKRIGDKLGLSNFTVELLEVLINKDRVEILDAVADELRDISDHLNDRVRIAMTTAYEPSAAEIGDISERIGQYFKSSVIVERSIDPDIIGGFILKGDGKLIDMSVRGQIRRILDKMKRRQEEGAPE